MRIGTMETDDCILKEDSYPIVIDNLAEGEPRLLEVDTYPILPTNVEIRFLITAFGCFT